VEVPLSGWQKSGLSLLVGFLGAVACYLFLRNKEWKDVPFYKEPPRLSQEILQSLDKAKQHLSHAQATVDADRQYELSVLLEEVEALQHSYEQPVHAELGNIQYAAVEKIFGYLQIVTACLMAFAHGANDVANAIGPLSAAISVLSTGVLTEHTPVATWTLALGGVGIIAGLATWGWRVIETIGKKITELTPSRGFAAEFGAAVTIVMASGLGLPISTTHTLVGSVLGVGLARGIEALNLATMRDIVLSWLVTVPAGALLCIVFFQLIKLFF
jgi:phosphate/sulfate permease